MPTLSQNVRHQGCGDELELIWQEVPVPTREIRRLVKRISVIVSILSTMSLGPYLIHLLELILIFKLTMESFKFSHWCNNGTSAKCELFRESFFH